MKSIYIFLFLVMFIACQQPENINDLATLLQYQKDEQRSHLEKDPELLIRNSIDTLIQIRNSKVSGYSRQDMRDRFSQYFNAVEFISWEDIVPPVFTFSDDSTMAHIMIQKRVILYEIADTTKTIDTTNFAWTELWRKKNGEWKLHVVTTTDDQ